MLDFIVQNYPTILVAAAVLGIFLAVLAGLVKKKRTGGASCACACGCASCPNSAACRDRQ